MSELKDVAPVCEIGAFGPGIHTSEKTATLWVAIYKTQKDLAKAVKDAVNSHLKNKYADLESVWDALGGPLHENGLVVCQPPVGSVDGGRVTIRTIIVHADSGQWLWFDFSFPLEKLAAHGVGSAITYCRRHVLAPFFGVCQTDDDGNGAAGVGGNGNANGNGKAQPPRQPTNQQPQGQLTQQPTQQPAQVNAELFAKILSAYHSAATQEILATCEARASKYALTKEQSEALAVAATERRKSLASATQQSDGPNF